MYSNYQSLKNSIEKEINNQQSVLNKFPDNIARSIVQACAKYLAQFTTVGNFSIRGSIDSTSSSISSTTTVLQQSNKDTGGSFFHHHHHHHQQQQQQQHHHQYSDSSSSNNLDKYNFIQFETSEQVNWVLENLMYGLTLSHEHQEIIRDCWNVYHDWMSVLSSEPKNFIPKPIKDDALLYGKKMLWHLYNLFVPRKENNVPTKHSMSCHAVLILLEDIAKNSKMLNNDLWENILKFILAINNAVLALPYNRDDFCDSMSSRLVATLFEIWLIACNKNFPSPSLWKTFQEMCSNWRHHLALVIEWNRVTYALTNRLLEMQYWPLSSTTTTTTTTSNGSNHEPLKKVISMTNTDTNAAYDIQKIINSMDKDTLIQSWFRFFHIIGNPIDFSNPILVSRTSEFVRALITHDNNKDIDDAAYLINHPCLKKLPQIFLEVIKGLSQIVDTFIGADNLNSNLNNAGQSLATNTPDSARNLVSPSSSVLNSSIVSNSSTSSNTTTSGVNSSTNINEVKTRTKSQSVTASNSTTTASQQNDATMLRRSMYLANYSNILSTQQINESTSLFSKCNSFKRNRPTVNSLLQLVGNWLFEAAITGFIDKTQSGDLKAGRKNTKHDDEIFQNIQQQQQQQQQQVPSSTKTIDFVPNMVSKDYLLGQAEAYGILCKIFSSCKTDERINIDYLTKFYTVLNYGLKIPQNFNSDVPLTNDNDNGEILTSILVNGANLFKINLQGIHVLLPSFLNALDAVFKLKYGKKESKERIIGSRSVSLIELKRQCINIFASIISLPNHFGSLTVESLSGDDPNKPKLTFYSLKQKILDIFLSAIQNELDIINLQMLFGCGRLIVGEWSSDELNRFNQSMNSDNITTATTPDSTTQSERKDKASFCYKQVVSLVCVPLKINSTHSTLVNHSFALSIFDALSSIATDNIINDDENIDVGKLAISWISHYVQMQIKRPSREHTREMHSVIVAAYHCLIVLIVQKPRLLRDKQCLQIISSCIEIGITGCSSYPEQKSSKEEVKESSSVLLKADKELKPASLRVKEAAESVLCVLMEYTDPLRRDDDDLQNRSIDEQSLLRLCGQTNFRNFKYFSINGTLIMALLEKSYSKSKTPIEERSPTVIMLLRGPFGRHAWVLQSRLSPFNKKISNITSKSSGSDLKTAVSSSSTITINSNSSNESTMTRSTNVSTSSIKVPQIITTDTSSSSSNNNRSNQNLPKCETNMPSLSDIASRYVKNLDEFRDIKQKQIRLENKAFEKAAKLNKEGHFYKECVPPKPCREFESIRIFLSNFNFGSIEPTAKTSREDLTEISTLDATDAFLDNMKALDSMSTRLFCNCFVYYVKSGQNDVKSILANVQKNEINDTNFYRFLESLGRIVDIKEHNGWTGAIDTSWKMIELKENTPKQTIKTKLNQINGNDNIIYWSDVTSEIAFILPDGSKSVSLNTSINSSTTDSGLGDSISSSLPSTMTQSFMEDSQKSKQTLYYANEVKLLVIWLEKMQDYDIVPINELFEEVLAYDTANPMTIKNAYCVAIFVQPLENGLYRTAIWNNKNKRYFYTMPLVDGMILSESMLGVMVRQTMLNVYRRKFESENYQPPHVRRKVKICDIIKKFNAKKTEADFYTTLLVNSKVDRKS